ncbi:MAG: TonB-dependent receptor [Bacteroidaceae bacterium]|nr:TonB-dependent receptor [Bacteroidaceae bacterium]
MKKILLMAGCLFSSASCLFVGSAYAQTPNDSLPVTTLGEAQVVSTRARTTTPVAFTNLKKDDIARLNYGQDLPFILSLTPGVVTTSDAGNGIGYTSIRVRGTDGTRINITNNGIPLNDAESHTLYFVDLPDFASSVQDIQIQRGAGTSTNGAAAFGASINMRTDNFARQPFVELSASYGSFNSQKETLRFGTGLLADHWSLDGRLSHIGSDGYRDRASTAMDGYFLQLGYVGKSSLIRLLTFGGKETTYHAWDGISRDELTTRRRYNPNGEIQDEAGNVSGFYRDQNDVFRQNHYQLLLTQILSPRWTLNAALHYTYGKGWYEEYKNNRTLTSYALQPFELDGNTIKNSDLVRRKYNRGNFGGGTFSLNYHRANLDASIGGAFNYFDNDHYGEVLWVKNYLGNLQPTSPFYNNTGRKNDANLYARAEGKVLPRLSVYADLQYRHIHYVIAGTNDDAYNVMNIHETFDFFNPKVGATYALHTGGKLFASWSVAHKEPSRNNYTDGFLPGNPVPRAERLNDFELGYRYQHARFTASANLYLMDYRDQLVNTGKINEIGEPLVENVHDSYRMGLEVEAAWQVCNLLRWDFNAAWSKNRIKNYTAYLYDADGSWATTDPIHIGTTPIALSPSLVLNNIFTLTWKALSASLQSQYVSRQYLDNLGMRESSLDGYFVSHLNVNYNIRVRGLKELVVGATVYNLFNAKYETNGYAMTSYTRDLSGTLTFHHDPRFYPMAGTNFLLHTTLKF